MKKTSQQGREIVCLQQIRKENFTCKMFLLNNPWICRVLTDNTDFHCEESRTTETLTHQTKEAARSWFSTSSLYLKEGECRLDLQVELIGDRDVMGVGKFQIVSSDLQVIQQKINLSGDHRVRAAELQLRWRETPLMIYERLVKPAVLHLSNAT